MWRFVWTAIGIAVVYLIVTLLTDPTGFLTY